jgi:PST family polysaccharide transporter
LKAVRQIIGFSGWIFLNNFLMFLRLRGASFVVGRFAGPSSLGVFELAYEISNLPTSALVMPINRALFPGYVQLREKPAEFRNGVIQVIGGVALLAIAAGVGIANIAPLIVEAFLGPKWHAATAPIQLLALFGVSIALQVNMQSVYNALGRPNLQASITAATVLLLLPLMIWLVLRDGVRGAATAYLITGVVMLPVNYAFCVRLVGFGWGSLVGVLWRPILAAAAMSWVLQMSIFSDVTGGGAIHAFGALIVASSVGLVVYCAVVAALWWVSGKPEGAESFMLRFAKRIAARTKDGARAG